MLPRPTSASHVSGTGEICTIAEKRPPRCGTRGEPISGNPQVCREEDRGTALAETARRTGVPAGHAHNPGARMIRSMAAAVAALALISFGARAEETAKPAAEAAKTESKDEKAEKTEKKAAKSEKAGVLSFPGVGTFSPFFQAWGLLIAMPNLRPGSSRGMSSQEFTMIRTIAAVLAAFVFVAFGA